MKLSEKIEFFSEICLEKSNFFQPRSTTPQISNQIDSAGEMNVREVHAISVSLLSAIAKRVCLCVCRLVFRRRLKRILFVVVFLWVIKWSKLMQRFGQTALITALQMYIAFRTRFLTKSSE